MEKNEQLTSLNNYFRPAPNGTEQYDFDEVGEIRIKEASSR